CTASALLLPWLAATTTDFTAGLGNCQVLTTIRKVRYVRLFQQIMILDLHSKDSFIQLGWSSSLGAALSIGRYSHYLSSPRIITIPLRGPGTAPVTPITPSSVSTNAIFRFLTVTCSTPIWPAIFLPLKMCCG